MNCWFVEELTAGRGPLACRLFVFFLLRSNNSIHELNKFIHSFVCCRRRQTALLSLPSINETIQSKKSINSFLFFHSFIYWVGLFALACLLWAEQCGQQPPLTHPKDSKAKPTNQAVLSSLLFSQFHQFIKDEMNEMEKRENGRVIPLLGVVVLFHWRSPWLASQPITHQFNQTTQAKQFHHSPRKQQLFLLSIKSKTSFDLMKEKGWTVSLGGNARQFSFFLHSAH